MSRSEAFPSPRYDNETLRKVAALAARLQRERQETYTADEIEEIGAEVGLDREFMRQALARLAAPPVPAAVGTLAPAVPEKPEKVDLRALALPLGIPLWWAMLVAVFGLSPNDPFPHPLFFLSPLPVAMLTGWLARVRRWAAFSGVELGLALSIALSLAAGAHWQYNLGSGALMQYLLIFTPGCALAAMGGAALRRRLFPRPPSPTGPAPPLPALSRPAMLEVVLELQQRLEREQPAAVSAPAAVLAVDRPGSAAAPGAGAWRDWAEVIVWRCGGTLLSAEGGALVCRFPEGPAALRAARRILQESARSGEPLRCALAAGTEPPAVLRERAGARQQQAGAGDVVVGAELAAAALMELGALAPLPEASANEPLFSWIAGQRAALAPRG